MKYELEKLCRDSRLMVVLAVVILLNAFLFWNYCLEDKGGYTLPELRDAYGQADTLTEKLKDAEAEAEQLSTAIPDIDVMDFFRSESEGDKAVIRRLEPVIHYHENREKLISESLTKVKLGLFGDVNGFSSQALLRGVYAYQNLAGIEPKPVFLGSGEALMDFRLTDVFLLVFMLVPGLTLFTLERGAGLRKLTQPTRKGHLALYLRKIGAAAVVAVLGYVILCGSNFLIAGAMFGFENHQVPIQSLYGFASCPTAITVGQGIAAVYLLKFLWMVGCFGLCLLCCVVTASGLHGMGLAGLFAGVGVLFQITPNLWLRNCSLTYLTQIPQLLQGAIYLNFFGMPIDRAGAAAVYLLLLAVGCLCLGGLAFGKGSHERCRTTKKSLSFRWGRCHTRLFLQETEKILFTHRVLLILLVFAAVQVWIYRDYHAVYSMREQYYHYYSEVLQGEPSEEKETYLSEENLRLQQVHEQINELMEKDSSGAWIPQSLYQAIEGEEFFREAERQYRNLQPGQSYLYQSGYEAMFSSEHRRDDALNWGKMLFFLILSAAGLFASEKETGVGILQVTAGKKRKVWGYKAVVLCICVLLLVLAAFLPKYLTVFVVYGGFLPNAQANSILSLSHYPACLSVMGVILLQFLVRWIVGCAAAFGVCLLSEKTGNTILTMEIAFPVLLIPVAIVLLL